ncbi:MAG: hypothetical protein A2283_03985 [Lentisphaerae bacterium RIFOXYA12_FULL_48_11]|nr:MAG: hypothetical protein A2283_03985 [Lentisphaerae bacterium RIFOXYA12_FULL_48_11]
MKEKTGMFVLICSIWLSLGVFVPAAVEIDASKKRPPVSPYIYGQFIEHLGRCIYGGIWAEMLEDRKFYFPVTDEYKPYTKLTDQPFPVVGSSPWQVMGPAGSVKMETNDPFVGVHTPLVNAGSGIRQKDLGLVNGKEYKGYIWLRAPKGKGEVAVTLKGGEGKALIRKVGDKYRKYEFCFKATESTDKGELEIAVNCAACLIGTVSLMPGDNIRGMRADTLAKLRELDSPIYRWPGGNFTSGYEWRDGIGDRDRRPPRKNPAWTGVEHNDFGTDEFLDFCSEIKTEPLIVVNTGLGGPYEAGQWVEYVNGAASTPMGTVRAANGRSKSYAVRWWGIGNEMYGPWQLGFMTLNHYILKHQETVMRMRTIDPSIKVVGVGAIDFKIEKHFPGEKRDWTTGMMEQCADSMDWISEHFYCQKKDDVPTHVRLIPDNIHRIAEGHRNLRGKLPSLAGKDVRISMDEWNYWYGPHLYGELGTRYFLKDALGIAAGLHEYFRCTDIIDAAFYAQTVNVIGCIKTTKTEAFLDSTALPLMLYRRHFGTLPLEITGEVKDIDVMAALSADGKKITIGIVNPLAQPVEVPVIVKELKLAERGCVWTIAGTDPMAFNDESAKTRLDVLKKPVSFDGILKVPAFSINVFEFSF